MDEPIRILHITEMLSAAGIESFIMNMYRNVDRTKVQFDFLVLRDQKEFYDEEVSNLRGHKYFVHSSKRNSLQRVLDESKQIEKFLKNHHYDIVHIHYTTPLRAPYLLAAKKAGVKVRIYHSHSAYVLGKSTGKLIIYKILQNKFKNWGTTFFACSEAAARWMYPESLLSEHKVTVVPNGIDTTRFAFNKEERNKLRKENDCEDKYVLINTGRYSDQKNQMFLIEMMRDLVKKDSNVVLWLLGKGDYQGEYEEAIKSYGLQNNVFLLGVKSNVQDYLSAADCYLMPSLYEGLPVAGIEAECSGLPCLFSTNITEEVRVTTNAKFLSLDSKDKWIEEILKTRNSERKDESDSVKSAGYDVHTVAKNLEKFYLSCVSNC